MIGRVSAQHRRLVQRARDGAAEAPPLPWDLTWTPVCASTEELLTARLQGSRSRHRIPTAVIAGRQRWGRGQAGRRWVSPVGGVWLSAALPWPEQPLLTADPGLAVAEGLAFELERLGVAVHLKWPNDLLAGGRKLAGFLPRLLVRGSRVRLARVGVGLNGNHPVPPGGIALKDLLPSGTLNPSTLIARVLRALEWAVHHADRPELVRCRAQRRLIGLGTSIHLGSEDWRVEGLAVDGGLLIRHGNTMVVHRRRF